MKFCVLNDSLDKVMLVYKHEDIKDKIDKLIKSGKSFDDAYEEVANEIKIKTGEL